jgi:murein L,D-transpeptidase YcbB/YkuD
MMAALLLFSGSGAAAAAPATPSYAAAEGAVNVRHLLPLLYSPEGPEFLWLADGGAQARLALQVLRGAISHGIDPNHYDVADLERRLGAADGAWSAELDRDISMAILQLLVDVRFGRTAPDYTRESSAMAEFDPVARLRRALQEKRLAQAIDAAAPAIPLYLRVKASLAQYRELARDHPDWKPLPAPARGARPGAGSPYEGTALLRARLALLGDLDPEAATGATQGDTAGMYGPDVAAALKQFQARHGLEEDGILGPGTLAALAVSPASRARQLELTLERLRWLPALRGGRMIAVNVPAYRLWAFDTTEASKVPPLEMRVIVGSGARTPTPLFIGQMRYLEFNPYWNVPRSIILAEIIPKLSANPAYLRQNEMELVTASGAVIADPGVAHLAALRAGTARVRQRPGPANVLGAVKFAMPNSMNIYLHSTSAKELFNRTRRDLSHGCIRVQNPAELAEFVLADAVRWNAQNVAMAMQPGPTSTVQLKHAVPVVLFYATAITGRDGKVSFVADIYRRDQKLMQALTAR